MDQQSGVDIDETASGDGTTSDEWVREGSSEVAKNKATDSVSFLNGDSETSPPPSADTDSSNSDGSNNSNLKGRDKSPVVNVDAREVPMKQAGTNSGEETLQLSRHELWVGLLGVRNKPDPLMEWDNLYNLKNQAALRRDCRALVERLDGATPSAISVPQLESMVTLYCKRRAVEYDPAFGWLDVLGKLLVLPFEQHQLFNVFYAITTKYVPKSSKMYDLFRLLMQYHDPELCSYLDSFRVQPDTFTADWFHTLLAKDTDTALCWSIWDKYFDRGDPFLIFIIALVFCHNARDRIFTLKDRGEILNLLRQAPAQMRAEDVDDLLDVCSVYLNYTPISIREDFHCMLFGSNLVDEYSEFPLNRLMCLPISVQELYRRAIDGTSASTSIFTYFVIDTRPQKCFNAGSIPGSYNLNGQLIVDEPEKFGYSMSSLMNFKEKNCPKDHICFIGSGREQDDQYLMMVISRFLHKNQKNISYVDGGYRALHSMLADTGNLGKLSNHFKTADCPECGAANKGAESKGWSLMERMKKAIQTRNQAVRSKLHELSSHPPVAKDDLRHVSSTEVKSGKRYRNVKSVFSIEHDGDSEEAVDILGFSDVDLSTRVTEKLRWAEVVQKPEITDNFDGDEVFPDKTTIQCFIAISRTHMHIFHAAKNEPGMVLTSQRHPLSTVMRVTSKRRFPEFLTFKFGYELPTGEAHINQVHCFIVPKAGDCAKAVKTAILALKPPPLGGDEDEQSD